jgi:anti-sigma factor RsiW
MRLLRRRNRPPEIACQHFVELVTDYLEGSLDPQLAKAAEAHLAGCSPCLAYLAQMRLTIADLHNLPSESLSQPARTELIGIFRDWSEANDA